MLDLTSYFRRRLRGAAIAALLCHAGIASALGFGAIRVHSALNEPLDATINLVALTPEEKSALSVDMASVDMFQRFGIERTALAERIRIATSDGNEASQVLLRLTTADPVREPFLRFLIEADTGAGRALREYTVLLDPPGQAPAAPASAPTPSTARTTTTTAASAPSSSTAQPSAPRSATPVAGDEPKSDRYGPVAQGETLSRIADRVRRPGTTLDQMQVAIYRNNPQAFSDNMNILLRGSVLAIPPVERIRAIDQASARSVVREQRQAAVTRIADERPAASSNTLAGAATPPDTTDARLRLEPPRVDGAGFSGAVGTAGFGRLTLPDFSTTTDSSPAAGDDTALAAGDAEAQPAVDSTDDPMVSSGSADAVTATDDQTAAEPLDSQVATPEVSENAIDSTLAATNEPEAATPADETATTVTDGEAADYQPLPSDAVDVTGAGSEGGLLQPRNLLLLAAVLLLLALLIVWNRRRQYKPVPLNFNAEDDEGPIGAAAADDEAPFLDEPDTHTASAPAAAGPAPALRVQEADRQMKLGLFEEARQGLEEGLAEHPDDSELQDKRLELDYVSGDAGAFVANVERFEASLAGDGVRWAGIASMGRVLVPEDPRFGFQTGEPTATPKPAAPDSPQAVFDSFEANRDDDLDAIAPVVDPAGDSRYFSIDDEEESDDTLAAAEPKAPTADDEPSIDEALTPRGGLDMPEDGPAGDQGPETLDIDDSAFADSGDRFEWQDQDLAPGEGRRHDQGDDPGMAFELDTDTPAEPEPPKKPVEQIDDSEFDLGADDTASDSEGSDTEDSVDVRLDLARMYLDMEDHATARELLEEAVNEGNESQRATAQELLNGL